MSSADPGFLAKLRQAFAMEANEQLHAISNALLELEKGPTTQESKTLVEVMFRQAHNLKGSAHAVNMTSIEAVCQHLEAVFSAMKKGELVASQQQLDVLHSTVEVLHGLLAADGKITDPVSRSIATVSEQLAAILSSGQGTALEIKPETTTPPAAAVAETAAAIPAAVADRHATMDNIRIAASKLDDLLLQAEEMLSVKRAAVQHALDLSSLAEEAQEWRKGWQKIDHNVRALRRLVERHDSNKNGGAHTELSHALGNVQKVLEFLEWNGGRATGWLSKLEMQNRLVDSDMRTTSSIVDTFLDRTKKLLMMPCAVLFELFPTLVRNTSRQLGKDVEFKMYGTEIELDKRILAKIRDPLVHLIRNSIDHGVEDSASRLEAGKPPRAQVTIAVNQVDSSMVEIAVSDDGRGIDVELVKKAAVKAGLLTDPEAAAMTMQQAVDLIFQSAFSTSPIITEISGHGLGLAIVKENITSLGGKLVVESEKGRGTQFKMFVPTTMATYTGILLNVRGQTVAIPKANLERVVRVKPSEVQSIENNSAILLDGIMVPLVQLADLLELPERRTEPGQVPFYLVAVVRVGETLLGVIVDAILEEQEVLVKSFGKPLNRVRNVSGVTILRSGEAVPILNVADLIKSARRLGSAAHVATKMEPRTRKRILVVDDTLTSRMLMKNIVEAAGYAAEVATDGLEALTVLLEQPFDLALLDVEMPRMTGLELTKKIRQNQKLHELPVIILTTLATKEDKERGVEAGANAYFVKSSFDQNSLLDTIKRLI